MAATATPRPRTAPGRLPPAPDPLPAAVDASLARLRNLPVTEQPSQPGDLEHRLRTALSTSRPARLGHTAARVLINEVMKRLTLIATVFLPTTFVVGFFGMNSAGSGM